MQEHLKEEAARAAVASEVRSGMKLGLGSGSTVAHALDAIGAALAAGRLREIVGVPTSEETARRAQERGIPLVGLDEVERLDVTIDGADEIDPSLDLIKGLGGALLREKMVAQITERFVIIGDEGKLVRRLGTRAPLPVEVVRFGWRSHLPFLHAAGARVERRESDGVPFETDNGNLILHCHFDGSEGIADPQVLDWLLLARAGIVGHGLFLDMAEVAYVAGRDGVRRIERPA